MHAWRSADVCCSAPARVTTGHVGLNVQDLERSTAFYVAVFGFDVLSDAAMADQGYVFLGYGDDLVLTLWQQTEEGFASDRAGLHHLSFAVADVSDVEEARERLAAMGTLFAQDGIVSHGPGAVSGGIFFYDPDGIRLEIFTGSGLEGHSPASGEGPACGFF